MFYGLSSLFISYEYLDMDLTRIIHNNKYRNKKQIIINYLRTLTIYF